MYITPANTFRFAGRNDCVYKKVQIDNLESMEQFRSDFDDIRNVLSLRIRPEMLELLEQSNTFK